MPNFVRGEGDLSSDIWLIGEAPGANEDKQGRPFVGGAGMVLNGLLAEAGIQREQCYIDNVIQYQPVANNFGVYYKDSKRTNPTNDLLAAHTRIRSLITSHRPNVVVALGNEALFAITGNKGITKWRGSILNRDGVKVIPTIHPAMIMRQYDYRVQSLFDFCKVKKEGKAKDFPTLLPDKFKISPSFDQAMTWLREVSTKPMLTFDLETGIETNQIRCIGFGWSKNEAFCIPIFDGNQSYYTLEEELALVKEMRKLFSNPSIKFIGQNGQFDMTYLWRHWGIRVANYWLDTMILHHCIYPELPKSLGFLVSIYTNHPYHKDMIHGGVKDLWTYNCMDCARTFEVAEEEEKEAREFGTWGFYRDVSHQLIMPLFWMQERGIKVDVEARDKLTEKLTKDKEELQRRLEVGVGHPLNVNSPKQMKEFLYEEFKYPPIYRKRKDQKTHQLKSTLSADDDALEELSKKYENPALGFVQEIRKIGKLVSTYLKVDIDRDNRIRCGYLISGTRTGRLSSRASAFGTGTNLQNIPRGELIRSLFVADEGYKMVNVDLSQAEARVVAYLANESRLRSVFEEGGDVHRKNAAILFKKPVASITEEERYLGKTLVHASNYKIGKRKFARELGTNELRAQGLLNTYFANYPRIRIWHMEVEAEVRKTRILTTPLGRKRMFFGRWGDDLVREAIAHVPQSTVGDLLNIGLIRASKAMPEGWEMLLQVHDSVMFQVPDYTDPMHIYKFCHHFFEIPIEVNHRVLKIPIDIKVGKDWGHLEKLEI